MNKSLLVALLAAPAFILPSSATSITAIYGAGNPAEGWTDNVSGEIQLALRAKNRDTGAAINTDGVYNYATAPATRGLWNYEFSINSDINDLNGTTLLNTYDYYLLLDLDPSQGVSSLVVNPLTTWVDNSYGNNSSAKGTGIEGTSILADSNNLVQNSQNITWGPMNIPLADNATYTFELFATKKGAGVDGRRLAEVDMTVVVGAGGAAVPDGGASAVLLGMGVACLAGLRMRKGAK